MIYFTAFVCSPSKYYCHWIAAARKLYISHNNNNNNNNYAPPNNIIINKVVLNVSTRWTTIRSAILIVISTIRSKIIAVINKRLLLIVTKVIPIRSSLTKRRWSVRRWSSMRARRPAPPAPPHPRRLWKTLAERTNSSAERTRSPFVTEIRSWSRKAGSGRVRPPPPPRRSPRWCSSSQWAPRWCSPRQERCQQQRCQQQRS